MSNKANWGKVPIDVKGNKPAATGKTKNIPAYLASNWIIAIDAWDYCDSNLLEQMLNKHPLPFELQPVMAEIISGKRVPNKKAAAKLKVPAGHRLVIAGLYAELKESVIDAVLQRKTLTDYHDTAESLRIEVHEYQSELQKSAREFKEEWALNAGISTKALENLYYELKEKLKNYPNI